MDRVRLGRVLGRGARLAARTVYEAVDAATAAPTPNTASRSAQVSPDGPAPTRSNHAPEPRRSVPQSQAAAGRTVERTAQTMQRVQGSARAARSGVLEPVKRASRAVSLEITGSFFALFALSFAAAAWRFRSEGPHGQRLWMCVGCAAVFGYFAVTSFLRARKLTSR